MKKVILCIALLLTVSFPASVHGIAYDWATLEPLNGTLVYVNSTPAQQLLSRDGLYSFNLGIGSYEITAKYYVNNSLQLETAEKIVVGQEGDYVMDLLMFPAVDLGEPLFNETGPDIGENTYAQDSMPYLILYSLAITAAALLILSRLNIGKKEAVGKPKRLPKEARQVLDIIENEQRLTQKELRKKLPWSEAKVSLVVADLEERGLIKKIKKGRGNIIKIG